MVDISILLEPWTVFTISSATALVAVILYYIVRRKSNRREAIILENDPYLKLRKEIDKIQTTQTSPHILLEILNNDVRYFFEEAFGINRNLEYSEARSILEQRGKQDAANLAQNLEQAAYSGEGTSQEKLDKFIALFSKIVEDEKFAIATAQKFYPSVYQVPAHLKQKFQAQQKKEHPSHRFIESMDHLDRIKHRIKQRKHKN